MRHGAALLAWGPGAGAEGGPCHGELQQQSWVVMVWAGTRRGGALGHGAVPGARVGPYQGATSQSTLLWGCRDAQKGRIMQGILQSEPNC